jgi:LPXTG-site transpeptidase (sortase) family protein
MQKRKNFGDYLLPRKIKARNWQLYSGLALLSLALSLSLQSFAQAADKTDQTPTFSVRSEVSDQEMFGKSLSTTRLLQNKTSATEIRAGTDPIRPSRLRIPAIGIVTGVETLGLRDGAMDVPTNIWNVGWLKDSAQPGAIGNAVIAGHKDSVKGMAIFWNLGLLTVGDKVFISDETGAELTFEVVEVKSYLNSQAPLLRIFGPSDQRQLNLLTCDGNFVREQRTYDRRLVVFTRLIANG